MISELNRGNSQAYCPQCLIKLDGFMAVGNSEGHRPKEGDVSMCLGCKTVLAFNADLTLRLANRTERAEFYMAMKERESFPISVSAAEKSLGIDYMNAVYTQLIVYLIRERGEVTLSVEDLQASFNTAELLITAEGSPEAQTLKFEVRDIDVEDELQAN